MKRTIYKRKRESMSKGIFSIFKHIIGSILVVLLITTVANADMLSEVRIGVSGAVNEDGSCYFTTCGYYYDYIQTGTASAEVSPRAWSYDPDYSGVGSGSASASYGSLGVYSTVNRITSGSEVWFYYFTAVSISSFTIP